MSKVEKSLPSIVFMMRAYQNKGSMAMVGDVQSCFSVQILYGRQSAQTVLLTVESSRFRVRNSNTGSDSFLLCSYVKLSWSTSLDISLVNTCLQLLHGDLMVFLSKFSQLSFKVILCEYIVIYHVISSCLISNKFRHVVVILSFVSIQTIVSFSGIEHWFILPNLPYMLMQQSDSSSVCSMPRFQIHSDLQGTSLL